MKDKLICLCLLFISIFTLQAKSTWKETRKVLFSSEKEGKVCLLQPGESFCHSVSFEQTEVPSRKFLRVIGGVKMPAPFTDRGESMFRQSEFYIDDNLDSVVRKHDRYSLYFKGENDPFERHAYYRIPGELLKQGELTVTLPIVKRHSLKVEEKGDFGLQLGLYYHKEGRAVDDIYDQPDSLLYISVPEGDGKFQQITQTFTLPENVANVFLQVGGTHFQGECWVEAPILKQGKRQVCSIPFMKHEQRTDFKNYWVGCNLATRSWPMWQLEYNGKTIFQGNIFDRASNVADFYIPLPKELVNSGEMKLSLLKEEHRAAYPYELRGVEIIEESARDYEVISTPKYVSRNASFGILVETNRPNISLQVSANGQVYPATQTCVFKEPGLHVVEFRAGEAGSSIPFIFDDGQRKEETEVCQVIDKAIEPIYLSVGDDIYMDKVEELYNYYFKWYLSKRAGNWMQFRPSYQWSGFRIADPKVIGYYTNLLNQLQVPYAWQVEGRTLAGSRINPSLAELASPMFRGKQAHENDGGYYYWTHFLYDGLYCDMAARNRPYGGIFAKHRPIYTDHGTFIHYDPQGVHDMAEGARNFVANLSYSRGESSRHTGPSSLFRYFYQAGYEWLGAEQMYGPEEVILSALRGASRVYNRPQYGSLHAMQWGSFPFTDPKHSLRLYMSLAVAYMHGSSHMNTEDALWADEYMHDRFSPSGKAHMHAQHQMLDFVETHARRGELHSNIAIIQGRNDAWKSFGRDNVWSQKGDKWKFNKACESFDLLNVYYPDNIISACGPEGWFTSTPYGTIDILPIEASLDVMKRYEAMVFLGWNTYNANDFRRIHDFVYQGGTLLLSAAHLNEELQPDQPARFPADDAVVRQLLGENYKDLREKTVIPCGLGKIIYFPQNDYPIESSLKENYVAVMKEIGEKTISNETDKGWMQAASSVGFSVWDQADRRTIYLLNTNWKSDEEAQPSVLIYKNQRFPIQVRQYHIETIHCAEDLAVMPTSNTTDVLSIQQTATGWNVKFQITEADVLQCMDATSGKVTELKANKAGIFTMTVAK